MAVFLSYCSRDRSFVRRLASDLSKARIEVWLDERELKVGETVGGDFGALETAIHGSACFIIIVSRSAAASIWVEQEIRIAQTADIPVLPVLVEDVPVEWVPLFAGMAHADFRRPKDYRRSLGRLVAAVNGEPYAEMFLTAKEAAAKVNEHFAPEGDLFGISQQGISSLYSSAVIGWESADTRDGASRWWVVEFFDSRQAVVQVFSVMDGKARELPQLHVGDSDDSSVDPSDGVQQLSAVRELDPEEIKRYTRFRPIPLNEAFIDSTRAVAAASDAAFFPAGPLHEEDDFFVLTALERDKRHQGRPTWKVSFFDPAMAESIITVGVDAGTGLVRHHRRSGELLNTPFLAFRDTEDGGLMITIAGTPRALGRRIPGEPVELAGHQMDDQAALAYKHGITARGNGELAEAASAFRAAAEVFEQVGDTITQAMALQSLGDTLLQASELQEATDVFRRELVIHRARGNHQAEAVALDNLGISLRLAGRLEEAIAACRQAAAIFAQTGDRRDEAEALTNLGAAHHQAREFDYAIDVWHSAVTVWQEVEDRRGEAVAQVSLGISLRLAGRLEEAIAACRQAAAIFAQTGDRRDEAVALANLGAAQQQAHQIRESIRSRGRSAGIFNELGEQDFERAAENLYNAAMGIGIMILILATSFGIGAFLASGVDGGLGAVCQVLDANIGLFPGRLRPPTAH